MPETPQTPLDFARQRLRESKHAIDFDGDLLAKARKKLCGRGTRLILPGELWVSAGERWPEALEKLIEDADRDPVAFDAAGELAAADLDKRKAPDPPLDNFLSSLARGKIKRPTRKGPSPYGNVKRDKVFAWLVYVLGKKFGCRVYPGKVRNLETCAFDIIHQAAEQEGINCTYEAIRKAWETYRNTFPQNSPSK